MKYLSITLLFDKIKRQLPVIAALGASFCLALSMTGFAGAVSAQDLEASPDASPKVPVGTLDAEDSFAADPIRACGPTPRDKDSSAWGKYFKVNGVNIRRSPSLNARICAQGQKSHVVDYHCWKVGSDGRTWTYLRDVTTRYAGWVRDSLLVGNGSLVHC